MDQTEEVSVEMQSEKISNYISVILSIPNRSKINSLENF